MLGGRGWGFGAVVAFEYKIFLILYLGALAEPYLFYFILLALP